MKKSIISDQVDQDLETAFKKIKEEAYEYVELHNVFGKSIEECTEEETQSIKKLLNKYTLKVSNLASTVFFLCPLYNHYKVSLFNPTFYAIEGDVEFHLQALENACRIAKELDCESIRIFPFRFPDNEDVVVVGTAKDQERIIHNFKKAIPIAEKYDVTLVVENCPYSHCPKGEMTLNIIKEINNPHIQLLWDPANSFRAEKHKVPTQYLSLSLDEEYELIKNNIKHIHLKNYIFDEKQEKPFIHTSLLEGDIDFNTLIKKIETDNYKYALSLEPEVEYDETILSMQELIKII